MATSSIFHNVIINDSLKAEKFISAIEASISDPYNHSVVLDAEITPNKDEINKLHELRRSKTRAAQ